MSNSNKGLFDRLKELSENNILPMHMPGHKRSQSLAPLGGMYDITEIDGFDDLHDPKGVIKAIEDRAAALWDAKRSRILVGGSTCGILSAIYAAAPKGSKIIMSRGCHRSVYHAVELCGLRPVYIPAPVDERFGMLGSVSPQSVKKAIDENPDAALVVITSPTYEGVISDVAEISRFTHLANIPLLVDEAHGAHLGIGGFSKGAVKCGADIVVQSLHKTLSCLTQSAILHVCSDRINDFAVSHAVDIFETSSPSYLIMASIDKCISNIEQTGFEMWENAIYANAEKLKKLHNLQLANTLVLNAVFDFDPSKLTVLTNGRINGFELAEVLRRDYKIEVEMASVGYIVAMSGMGDTYESLDRFTDALLDIDSREELFSECSEGLPKLPGIPASAMSISDAVVMESESVDAELCPGRISAEYVMAYPPGVPVIVPGEIFTDEILKYIADMNLAGANIKSRARAPYKYAVVKR